MAKQRLKPKLTREEMNNQYLNSIFEEFMAEKKALGREPDTLKAYQVTFNEFYKYFGERAEETGDIVASMFIEWTNSMKDRGLRPATINHHLMGMRTFMYWCMDEERQYIDRFKIRLVRVQDEMPKEQARVFSQNHPPGLCRLPMGWGSSHRGKYTRAQRRGFKPHLCVLIFCNSAYPC